MTEKFAFITYESPFAPCGGIAAVIARLPGYVQKASGLQTVVITPFHRRIAATASLKPYTAEIGTINTDRASLKILRYEEWSHIRHLQNPDLLITLLQNKQDPFACFLREHFPEDIRGRLEGHNGSPGCTHDLAQAVAAQLTLLINGGSLYEKKIFTGKKMSEAFRRQAAREPGEQDYRLLNYTLLRECYPECIPAVRPWPWYFLDAGHDPEQDFFNGYPHPYALDEEPVRNSQKLLRDALLFGTGAAQTLPAIDPRAEWILLMQDWETATTVLALNGHIKKCRPFLILHNSYDSHLTDHDICNSAGATVNFPGNSILGRVIPHIERPVFTVSEQFAHDLTSDLFQVQVMADHLQELLSSGFIGVDNGPFENLHVPLDILEAAVKGSYHELQSWKAANRKTALAALKNIKYSEETPVWGDLQNVPGDHGICWFVMSGRDDPRQKGYDVAVAAIRHFLQEGGDACFFFFPIPGDEGLPGLAFQKSLAWDFPGRVIVFPFRWQEGYFAALRGAAYGIMPSFYEPFGAANEFYLNGTVGIGRATGGLLQQIVPLRAVASFSLAVRKRISKWHSQSAHPTGLLFREKDNIASVVADWKGINQAAYNIENASGDRIEERLQFATYREMVNELFLCFKDAAHIYNHRPELYYRMIKDGIIHIQNSFSWERAAHEYIRHILNTTAE